MTFVNAMPEKKKGVKGGLFYTASKSRALLSLHMGGGVTTDSAKVTTWWRADLRKGCR